MNRPSKHTKTVKNSRYYYPQCKNVNIKCQKTGAYVAAITVCIQNL